MSLRARRSLRTHSLTNAAADKELRIARYARGCFFPCSRANALVSARFHEPQPMFDIRFVMPASETEGVRVQRGRITLGDFAEEFEAPLQLWSAVQYEAQWRAAAKRLVSGERGSGFVVWATDMKEPPYALWWPAWHDGDRIVMQNQLLFDKDFPHGLDLEAAYTRAHHAELWFEEDDERPSTWYLDRGDFVAFLDRDASLFAG